MLLLLRALVLELNFWANWKKSTVGVFPLTETVPNPSGKCWIQTTVFALSGRSRLDLDLYCREGSLSSNVLSHLYP